MDTFFAVSAVMSLVDNITGPLRGVRAGMTSTEAQAGRLSGSMAGLTKVLLPLAVAAGIFLGAIAPGIGTAANFEAAISQVGAVSRATAADLAKLEQSALDFGSSTAFTSMQVAGAQEELARKGFKTNQIIGSMPGLLSLAAAAKTNLATAATVTSGAIKSFNLQAEQSGQVADVIAAASATSATNVEGLGMALQNAGAVVAGQKGDFALLAAVIGKLADANIDAAVGSTALKIMTNRLAAPTGGAAKELGKLGIAYRDVATGDALPFLDVMKNIETAMQGMGTGERAGFLKTIFGEEAIGSATALFGQGIDSLAKYHAYLQSVTGTADEMAKGMLNNFKGAVTILGSAWEGLQISIGNIFLPVLTPLVRGLSVVVGWLNTLARTTVGKTIIGVGTALAMGVIGVTLFSAVGAGLSLLLPILSAGLVALGTVIAGITWPVWVVVAAVVGLFAAFKANFMGITDVVTQLWTTAKLVAQGVTAVFDSLKGGVGTIEGALAKDIRAAGLVGLVTTVAQVLHRIRTLFSATWAMTRLWAGDIGKIFAPVWESVVQAFSPLIPAFKTLGAAISWVVRTLWGAQAATDVSSWEFAGHVIGSVVGAAFHALAYAVRIVLAPVQMVMGIVGGLIRAFVWLGESIGNVCGWFAAGFGAIPGLIDRVGSGVVSAVQAIWDEIEFVFMNFTPAGWIIKAVLGIQDILNGVDLSEAGSKLMGTFAAGIKATLTAPLDLVKTGLMKIRNFLPGSDAKEGPLSTLTASGQALLETFGTGIRAGIPSLEGTVKAGAAAAAASMIMATAPVDVRATILPQDPGALPPLVTGVNVTDTDLPSVPGLRSPVEAATAVPPRTKQQQIIKTRNTKPSMSRPTIIIQNLNLPDVRDGAGLVEELLSRFVEGYDG